MLYPVKVIQLELSQPLPELTGLEGYRSIQALVRLHGQVLGYAKLPVLNGGCDRSVLEQALEQQLSRQIRQALWTNGLTHGLTQQSSQPPLTFAHLRTLSPPEPDLNWPLISVAVCTRDRPTDLARCLDALQALDYPRLELLVIDNAPSDDASEAVVAHYEGVRYLQEPRPGLDWARNRALREAQGEIIAYTDDDVCVDRGWVKAIARAFAAHPDAMAVTGLVVPAELETEAQVLFEANGGFGKGFETRKWIFPNGTPSHWSHVGTGNIGTGANMAYRRIVFDTVGDFDTALDVGTPTNGAGDLEMFLRVLAQGFAIVYEPQAVIFHHHRRSLTELHQQLFNNGAVYACMIAAAQKCPRLFPSLLLAGLFWLVSGHILPLFKSLFSPQQFPRSLRWAQLSGCFRGLTTYSQAQRQAAQIEQTQGALPALTQPVANPRVLAEPSVLDASFSMDESATDESATDKSATDKSATHVEQDTEQTAEQNEDPAAIAVRLVRLGDQALAPLTDIADFATTRVFVEYRDRLWGFVDITNDYQALSPRQLAEAIASAFPCNMAQSEPESHFWNCAVLPSELCLTPEASTPLASTASVAIVVGTCDRPDDLRRCLAGLTSQQTSRPLQIIVVDNRPGSGLTPPVVAEFAQAAIPVHLVSEARAGVAYARNAGILAALAANSELQPNSASSNRECDGSTENASPSSEIIVTVDDDVALPNDWLEKLISPFARADVMGVTGNVLPRELKRRSQRLFENYGDGGLGRGFRRFQTDGRWFSRSWLYAVPTWELGGTANSAYRASIFTHPAIGLMDEALGPGMPSGVGEDIYLFYRLLKADQCIVYQADAYLWHTHRRNMAALSRQLYNYSKGFISYHLTTLFKDRDYRALGTLLVFLPLYHLKRILLWPIGDRSYPLGLILTEIRGNLAGPWSLWRSRQLVKRWGLSRAASASTTGAMSPAQTVLPTAQSASSRSVS